GPGSRAEDTADLAALIEHLGGGPVHVVGNSYGAIITLTLVTTVPIWSPVPPCTSRPCSACWTSPPMRRSPTRWLPAAEGSLPSPG
ncbi:MAG: alpha/beta fold hydrolase, partial [Egibacteraceae bacterium]